MKHLPMQVVHLAKDGFPIMLSRVVVAKVGVVVRRCIRWWCCNSGGQWSQRVHCYMVLDELRPVTKAAAIELQRACPWVVFTSGYRSWMDQARAMAQNVVKSRTWLGQVYKHEPELQAWVAAHPNIIDV